MNEAEQIARAIMNDIYTNGVAEIVEIGADRRVRCKLVSGTQDMQEGPVVNVPVLMPAGMQLVIKKGMRVPIFFCKNSISKIKTNKGDDIAKNCLQERQFNRDNGFILPFIFSTDLDNPFAETMILQEDVICEKKLTVKGLFYALIDAIIKEISFLTHSHSYTPGDNPPANTSPPGGA